MRFAKKALQVIATVALVAVFCLGLALAYGNLLGNKSFQAVLSAQLLGAAAPSGGPLAAKAVLYSNGDLVFQATTKPDGSVGHTEADVVARYDDASATRIHGATGIGLHPWYERRTQVKTVSVNGNVSLSNAARLFDGCTGLVSVDLTGLDTLGVQDVSYMFSGCTMLSSLNLSGLNTSNMAKMNGMFWGCASLPELDLSGFNTSNVTDMRSMFDGCSSLTFLDLSSFDTSKVQSAAHMFNGCRSLQAFTLGPSIGLQSDCRLPGGNWTHQGGDVSFATAEALVAGYDGALMTGSWVRSES